MNSIILDCIKNNTFIPYPDYSFSTGTDGKNFFSSIDTMLGKNNKSIKDLEEMSYTTWKYCGHDSEENLKLVSKLAEKDWCYRDSDQNSNSPLIYTLNSFGYRTKNFNEIDWENSIVIFGCSFIQGVGVHDNNTVTYFLEKEMGLPVINMGVGGASNQTHIHNSMVLSTKYPKPKAVILSLSGLQRYPFYHWNYVENRGDWTDKKTESVRIRSNSIISNIMGANMINQLWSSKTTYIEYSSDHIMYNFMEDANPQLNRFHINPGWPNIEYSRRGTTKGEFARDFIHPGKDFHQGTAKMLAEILKSRID